MREFQIIKKNPKKCFIEVETVIIWATDKFTFSSMYEEQGELQELCMDKT